MQTPRNRYCRNRRIVLLCSEPNKEKHDRNFLRQHDRIDRAVAQDIAKQLGIADADVHNVADASADETDKYDLLVLGSPTWGNGAPCKTSSVTGPRPD